MAMKQYFAATEPVLRRKAIKSEGGLSRANQPHNEIATPEAPSCGCSCDCASNSAGAGKGAGK